MSTTGKTKETISCTACNSSDLRDIVHLRRIPVHCNVLWQTRDAAIAAPRGDMSMMFCNSCGHVFNGAFDARLMEYTPSYENSLHFSPRFQQFAEELARHLIERYELKNKSIIDLGCGKGDFLKLICRLGDNRGYGFDPSYVPDEQDKGSAVTFVQEFYSENHMSYDANLVSCRHVLEHIQFPRDFLTSLRRAIGNRPETAVYFEVPNVLYTLRDLGVWDIIYEHCSYFSRRSLGLLFAASGFRVNEAREIYDGQFIGLEAYPAGNGAVEMEAATNDLEEMRRLVQTFGEEYRRKIGTWQSHLEGFASAGKRVVLWGGGSKGVTFLNTFDTNGKIEFMVDINPRKQGMYVSGSGQRIIAPQVLRQYNPDTVVIMNPIYKGEIEETLSGLGLNPEILVA